jgi:hypothetical protein
MISIDGYTGATLFRFFQAKSGVPFQFVQVASLSVNGSPGERINNLIAGQIEARLNSKSSVKPNFYQQSDYNALVVMDLNLSLEELANLVNGDYVEDDVADTIALSVDDAAVAQVG